MIVTHGAAQSFPSSPGKVPENPSLEENIRVDD
jgi:hypothetical protein